MLGATTSEVGEKLRNPEDLYELDTDLPEMTGPVLLHSLDGFVDAGSTGQLVREHLLEALEHRVIARFDVDSLIDYRARRPPMTFDRDHWASYEAPELVRSEEHTSELQSREKLVCRLLLEKKNDSY